jgi:acyl-CoA reductase-like NAD-dependent aldehyde dehydrogenase
MNARAAITAWDPTRDVRGPVYESASRADAADAVQAAVAAWRSGALRDPVVRARALNAIAARLEVRADDIVATAGGETGLGADRLLGELARTVGQLRAFAAEVEDGSYVEAIIDRPAAGAPLQADVRRMLVPLGPIAVFGASNFPLAFSTAGGDTASALAAGCPVVFKGHPAHPGTSLRVAGEIAAALGEAGLPAGTFGHVLTADVDVARALVEDPSIEAVAFTGSPNVGQDIWRRANARPRPIPVFAEMGSVNPVVVREPALRERGAALAAALVASVSGSAGQLCTKPGVVLIPAGARAEDFADAVARGLASADTGPMLTPGLAANLRDALARPTPLERHAATPGDELGGANGCRVAPVLMRGSCRLVVDEPAVLEERFGPVVVLLTYADDAELLAAIEALPGQLTCTLHTVADQDPLARRLADALAERCGRLLLDGMPTGVLVNRAMQHGGPWPATTAPAHTSVGMTAIRRFLRPVAWQSAPESLLPPELHDGNPRGIWRLVDGERTREPLV